MIKIENTSKNRIRFFPLFGKTPAGRSFFSPHGGDVRRTEGAVSSLGKTPAKRNFFSPHGGDVRRTEGAVSSLGKTPAKRSFFSPFGGDVRRTEGVSIPESWQELTPNQFAETIHLASLVFAGKLSVYDFRLKLLQFYTGYKRSKTRYSESDQEQINSNLFILADMIKFPLKPYYPDPEILEVLSKELQKKLKTLFPFEIFDPEYIPELKMVKDSLKYFPILNLNIKKNPIPELSKPDRFQKPVRFTKGPTFTIDQSGTVKTDMIAGEYVDAVEFLDLYDKTGKEHYLNTFVSVLYRADRTKYSTFAAQDQAKLFQYIDDKIKLAIVTWFRSVQLFISEIKPYYILFTGKQTEPDKISLGLSDTLYSLTKGGYGTREDLIYMPLVDYLNLMVKQIKDAVQSLRAMDKNNGEIAKQLKMSLNIVTQL